MSGEKLTVAKLFVIFAGAARTALPVIAACSVM